MTNYRYSIVFVIVAIISAVVGQKFTEQRAKMKFRPPSDWFANMQPQPVEPESPSYFEQNDQPAPDENYLFQDVFVENREPEVEGQFFGGSKFVRHTEIGHFQSLCPIKEISVVLYDDPHYEYRPDRYVEVKCSHPFGRNAEMHLRNKVCGHHGFSCVQRTRTIFLSRRLKGTDCWEVEAREEVPSGCECMWPQHTKGDIIHHH